MIFGLFLLLFLDDGPHLSIYYYAQEYSPQKVSFRDILDIVQGITYLFIMLTDVSSAW